MKTPRINSSWDDVFGSAFPSRESCREAFHDCWIRIHSLPDSKRYPDSEEDVSQLLLRHNLAADLTLGKGSECEAFIIGPIDKGSMALINGTINIIHPSTERYFLNDDSEPLPVVSTRTQWEAGVFDKIILSIADDEFPQFMLVNYQRKAIYSPYDGGADLFLLNPLHFSSVLNKLKPWMSAREDFL